VRHRKPVEARQLDVEEDDGRPQRCDGLERRITVRSLPDDREALRLEQRAGRDPEVVMVVDDLAPSAAPADGRKPQARAHWG